MLSSTCVPACFASDSSGRAQAAPKFDSRWVIPAGASPERRKKRFKWDRPLAGQPGGFLPLVESLSGKPVGEETRDLLAGVYRITREGDRYEFHRSDGESLVFTPGTEFGDHLNEEFDDIQHKVERLAGSQGVAIARNLNELKLEKDTVSVGFLGAQAYTIDLSKVSHKAVKELRLGRLSAKVATSRGHASLKSIEGITVVVNLAGLSCPIEIKEFSRTRLENGDTQLTVGIRNPLPIIGSFFFKVIPISIVIKKKTDFRKGTRWKKEDGNGHKWTGSAEE